MRACLIQACVSVCLQLAVAAASSLSEGMVDLCSASGCMHARASWFSNVAGHPEGIPDIKVTPSCWELADLTSMSTGYCKRLMCQH
jgi:hypothetical protein